MIPEIVADCKQLNALNEIIRQELHAAGVLPFARFMELALYHPDYGYYERAPKVVGKEGDFYTSVSVGALFGELLGAFLAERFKAQSKKLKPVGTTRFQIVEAGAHDGALARDILSYWRDYQADTFAQLEYWIVEPSVRRWAWQREALKDFSGKVWWVKEIEALPETGAEGIIFANELVDAFPVRRVGWDARSKEWFEWGVGADGRRFDWVRMKGAVSDPLLALPPELLAVLPDGFTTELCPAAVKWWSGAAAKLSSGCLLTLDYGLTAEDFFQPQRKDGTLRAYREHRQTGDVLEHAGEQDLTAHVNFTALQQAGEAAGLKTEALVSQAQFLTALAEPTMKGKVKFPEWTAQRVRQFQTLTHPEHLGRPFKVLVQVRQSS